MSNGKYLSLVYSCVLVMTGVANKINNISVKGKNLNMNHVQVY